MRELNVVDTQFVNGGCPNPENTCGHNPIVDAATYVGNTINDAFWSVAGFTAQTGMAIHDYFFA